MLLRTPLPNAKVQPLEHDARGVNLRDIEVGGPEDRYRSDTPLPNMSLLRHEVGWISTGTSLSNVAAAPSRVCSAHAVDRIRSPHMLGGQEPSTFYVSISSLAAIEYHPVSAMVSPSRSRNSIPRDRSPFIMVNIADPMGVHGWIPACRECHHDDPCAESFIAGFAPVDVVRVWLDCAIQVVESTLDHVGIFVGGVRGLYPRSIARSSNLRVARPV